MQQTLSTCQVIFCQQIISIVFLGQISVCLMYYNKYMPRCHSLLSASLLPITKPSFVWSQPASVFIMYSNYPNLEFVSISNPLYQTITYIITVSPKIRVFGIKFTLIIYKSSPSPTSQAFTASFKNAPCTLQSSLPSPSLPCLHIYLCLSEFSVSRLFLYCPLPHG